MSDFKVGDWVNIRADAENGNADPGRVEEVADDHVMIRWHWEGLAGDEVFPWSMEDIVHVSPPPTS